MSAVPNVPASIAHKPITIPDNTDYSTARIDSAVERKTASINGHTADTAFRIHDHSVENFRPLKVIVIGAGYSGIYCGIRIPERLRNIDLVIYEKNAGVGGTWYENRYPGCACDIPSHSYQFSFEPNKNWSAIYAPAQEIQQYLERTAKKYSADRFIKLRHEIQGCRFEEREGKWHVQVKKLETGETFEDTADVVISARGNLNNIAWPDIPGLREFKGPIMHSAKWDEKYDFKDKKIGVIGSGSSAIQIIPSLQRLPGTQLSCFIRSRTWISPPFSEHLWGKIEMDGFKFTEDQKARFQSDPEYYNNFRLEIEEDGNNIHSVTMKGSEMQVAGQQMFKENMQKKLASRPDIIDSILPSFAPGCRRLTPGPGFLEALIEPNIDFVNTPITRIEEKGVVTKDGKLHEIDALVCATGFHSSAPPPFTVQGLEGKTIVDHWKDRPSNYLSLATDSFPNHFMMLGPNAAIGSGSLTMMIENVGDYIVKCVRKIQKDDIKSMSIKSARVNDFTDYADAYFKGTVFMDECKSWYRRGDKITGLWPGSTLHCIEALRSPRWEDYEYEYRGEDGNRMAWLGNGWSEKQREEKDLAWYLYPEFVNVPTAPKPEESKQYQIRPFSY